MIAALPRDACDCHAHVFGPVARFPYAEPRSYTPEDAPVDAYLAHLDRLGCARGVLVQPSAYGLDNAAMIAAMERAPSRLRGVAVGGAALTPATLKQWHAAGIRALRVNEFRRDGKPYYQNGVRLTDIEPLFGAMADLGWHLQLWIDARDLPDMMPALNKVPFPVVVDHMGRMDYRNGTAHPGFQSLVRGVGGGRLWAKVSGTYRLGTTPPDYPEARPFHDALIAANPSQLVWGSDWPHPRPEGPVPDAKHLLALFVDWTPSARHREQILAENPARLYDFPLPDRPAAPP